VVGQDDQFQNGSPPTSTSRRPPRSTLTMIDHLQFDPQKECKKCHLGVKMSKGHMALHSNFARSGSDFIHNRCEVCFLAWTNRSGLVNHLALRLCSEGESYYEQSRVNAAMDDEKKNKSASKNGQNTTTTTTSATTENSSLALCERCGLTPATQKHMQLHDNFDRKDIKWRCNTCSLGYSQRISIIQHWLSKCCAEGKDFELVAQKNQ
jgi:hypothetical protein